MLGGSGSVRVRVRLSESLCDALSSPRERLVERLPLCCIVADNVRLLVGAEEAVLLMLVLSDALHELVRERRETDFDNVSFTEAVCEDVSELESLGDAERRESVCDALLDVEAVAGSAETDTDSDSVSVGAVMDTLTETLALRVSESVCVRERVPGERVDDLVVLTVTVISAVVETVRDAVAWSVAVTLEFNDIDDSDAVPSVSVGLPLDTEGVLESVGVAESVGVLDWLR